MNEYESGYVAGHRKGFGEGYHLAFTECAALMQRYVGEKWIGHPADIIRGSEKLTHQTTYDTARELIEHGQKTDH